MEKVRQIDSNSFEIELTPNTVTVTFKLDEEIMQKLDFLVKELGFQNRSELIRDAIEKYLKHIEGIR
ncbi:MAG: ribbon-helix-helix domain-containing protein [Sulfolobaceae archaeon]